MCWEFEGGGALHVVKGSLSCVPIIIHVYSRSMAEVSDRVRGSLLGLAVCDAVGTAVEFMPPGSFEPVTDMRGGGKFSLQPGQVSSWVLILLTLYYSSLQWTDDTSMALCLAESLIECHGFNPVDQSKRYWSWYEVRPFVVLNTFQRFAASSECPY